MEDLKAPLFKPAADGWFHIAPLGTFDHPSGVKQVIDAKACESMVNSFRDEAKAENFPGLLVDFDHFSSDSDQSSEAAGWINDLANKEDGLYAKIKMSDTGDAAIKGGRYRLVSPVWKHRDCEELGGAKVRPLRLDSVGLTNSPNIKGMRPLTNRDDIIAVSAYLNRSMPETTGGGTAEFISVPRAVDRRQFESILNSGTSEGAKKGWETRHGAMAGEHAGKAADAYARGDNAKGDLHMAKAYHHVQAAKTAARSNLKAQQERNKAIDRAGKATGKTTVNEADIEKYMKPGSQLRKTASQEMRDHPERFPGLKPHQKASVARQAARDDKASSKSEGFRKLSPTPAAPKPPLAIKLPSRPTGTMDRLLAGQRPSVPPPPSVRVPTQLQSDIKKESARGSSAFQLARDAIMKRFLSHK